MANGRRPVRFRSCRAITCLWTSSAVRARATTRVESKILSVYARRNLMVPIPQAASWEEINARLEVDCRRRREQRLRGHTETIRERFQRRPPANTSRCCAHLRPSRSKKSPPRSKTRCGRTPSASMRCAICCFAALSAGRRGSI
jgi:hypothetical protein